MEICLVQTNKTGQKGWHSVCFTKNLADILGPNNPHNNIDLRYLQCYVC